MRLHILLLATLPLPLVAQLPRDSIVTVSATRVSHVRPDRASFFLVVEGTAETTTDAIARVDTKVKAVVDAMKTFGARVNLDPPVGLGVGPSPAPNGYPGVANPAM